MRSLFINGAANYDELGQHLRSMEQAFQTSVKDLRYEYERFKFLWGTEIGGFRSQVVREACITIAFMSQQLQNKLDHFAEALLNPLIILIPNSAKVTSWYTFLEQLTMMSSSGDGYCWNRVRTLHHSLHSQFAPSSNTGSAHELEIKGYQARHLWVLRPASTHMAGSYSRETRDCDSKCCFKWH